MPTDSPPPSPPRRRRRRWLRLCLGFFLALGLALAGVVYFATRHLPQLAKWALERAFPGATVEIRKLEIVLPDRLTIESLTLKSRKDGSVLLTLGGGSLTFNFDDLRRRQIGEIRLTEPVINASPRFPEAFVRPAGPSAPATQGIPWSVRRLVCDYGELNVAEFGAPQLAITAKFCFDFKDFSPTMAPTAEHELVIWDVVAAHKPDPHFLSLDLVRARFDLDGLIKDRTLKSVALEGGSLILGKSLRSIFATPPSTDQTASAPPFADPAKSTDAQTGKPWILGTLDLRRIGIRLEDGRPEISDITFALNTSLKNIPLSQSASNLGWEPQLIEIANLDIASPLDPFTKVLTLDSLFIRFTLAGLLRREIDSLTILTPTIYVGEDLFWYMDDMQKRLGSGGGGEADTGPGWKVRELIIDYGRLTLGSGGRRQYGLPLGFRTRAEDVALDNLAALKLQAVLEVPPQKYVFDSYQLEFTSEKGELRFAYPPEKNINNLVGTIRLQGIRWRQYKASDSWVSVTFDEKGINGTFGGKVYRGDVTGGFSFFFQSDSPWIGWVSGKGVSLREFTKVIAPQNFQMSGPLDFRLQMDAQGHQIDRVLGDFRVTKPGRMVIGKLDDLIAMIPSSWNLAKQSSTRIALETLRDFDYTKAGGDFWFVQSQGVLRLALQGPGGSRNFDVVLHADDSPEGRWKRSVNR